MNYPNFSTGRISQLAEKIPEAVEAGADIHSEIEFSTFFPHYFSQHVRGEQPSLFKSIVQHIHFCTVSTTSAKNIRSWLYVVAELTGHIV